MCLEVIRLFLVLEFLVHINNIINKTIMVYDTNIFHFFFWSLLNLSSNNVKFELQKREDEVFKREFEVHKREGKLVQMPRRLQNQEDELRRQMVEKRRL